MRANIRYQVISVCVSLLLTGMQMMGFHISMKYQTSVHTAKIFAVMYSRPALLFPCMGIVTFLLCYTLVRCLFPVLECKSYAGQTSDAGSLRSPRLWITALILFLCWLPCLAASYPGFFNYDVAGQVPQVLYPETEYDTFHPLLHTLIMGTVMKWGYLLAHETSLVPGIFLHSLFQMSLCAVVFAYSVYHIRRITGRKWLVILAILYYSLFPVIAMFAMSTTKDVMCCLVLQLCVIQLYNLFAATDAFLRSRRQCIWLIVCLVLLCLLRKNSVYAVALFVLTAMLFLRENRRKIGILIGGALVIYVICNRGMIWALNARTYDMAEAFSVPLQQIARVYCANDGESAFTEEELKMLRRLEKPWQQYNPLSADDVKDAGTFQPVTDNPVGYLWMWVKIGLRYPKEYVMAFLENTYQAWYPGTSIVVSAPDHEIYYFASDMCIGMKRSSYNEKLLGFYEKISKEHYYQKVPVIRLLFSIGAMFWVALLTFCYGLWCRDRSIVYPLLLILAFCATSLLGPVALVRYYLMLFYGFPVFLGYLFKRRAREELEAAVL